MRDEPKLRVWRSEGIGEFHEVSDMAQPSANIVHPSLALCLVEHGAYDVRHGGVTHSVGDGMLLVVQSGDITSGGNFRGKAKYREFHCAPEALGAIAEEVGGGLGSGRIFQSPFVCDEALGRHFLEFHRKMSSAPTPLEGSSLIRDFVGQLLLRYGRRPEAAFQLGDERYAVRRVRDCLEDRYAEPLTLEELARVAALSPFHLVRVFRKEVGLPPHAYQTRIRLNRARALLAQGASIGEAALNTGFFDQSHFTNHFRKVFGYPPGVYRKGATSPRS
jgi:AraC-like DNA-binding protein